MNTLGQRIRKSRENQHLLLRQLAAHIEVDTALISKAERGERKLNRAQVVQVASFLKESEKELIALWLCDKILEIVNDDSYALNGIKKAMQKIK